METFNKNAKTDGPEVILEETQAWKDVKVDGKTSFSSEIRKSTFQTENYSVTSKSVCLVYWLAVTSVMQNRIDTDFSIPCNHDVTSY